MEGSFNISREFKPISLSMPALTYWKQPLPSGVKGILIYGAVWQVITQEAQMLLTFTKSLFHPLAFGNVNKCRNGSAQVSILVAQGALHCPVHAVSCRQQIRYPVHSHLLLYRQLTTATAFFQVGSPLHL